MDDLMHRLVGKEVALRIDGSPDTIIGVVEECLDGIVDIYSRGIGMTHRVVLDRIAVVTVLDVS